MTKERFVEILSTEYGYQPSAAENLWELGPASRYNMSDDMVRLSAKVNAQVGHGANWVNKIFGSPTERYDM